MIAGSWERHLCWLHTERGPWRLCRLPSAPPSGTAQWSLVLSISRSSPAPHLRHSSTRASLGCGSNLAPLGRSLALVHRFALSPLSVPSSPCRDTAFWAMELLPLPVWLVSCGTPFLGSSDAPSGPPLLPCAPQFIEPRCRVTHYFSPPSWWPLRATAPGCAGRFAACNAPLPPLVASSRSGTAWCTLFPPSSLSLATFHLVLPRIPPLLHVLLSSLSDSPPRLPPVPSATLLVCAVLLAGV